MISKKHISRICIGDATPIIAQYEMRTTAAVYSQSNSTMTFTLMNA